jgi:cytochrome c peroxidase
MLVHPKQPQGMRTSSCSACHNARSGFQPGRRQGIGEGGAGFGEAGELRHANPDYPIADVDVQPLRPPSSLNTAFQKNVLWNGGLGATGVNTGTEALWTPDTPLETNNLGFEGVESQAIAGFGVHRLGIDAISNMPQYQEMFAAAYPDLPAGEQMTDLNASLAIASFERTVMANQSPFQRWLRGERDAMTDEEIRGARLFFGKAACDTCHTGPALNSMEFHAVGFGDLLGSDIIKPAPDAPDQRGRGSFTNDPADDFKFKVPQLYNLASTGFYGHGSTFTSVRDVVVYYNNAIPENPNVPASNLASDFVPLGLSPQEIDDLTAFLSGALLDPNLRRYEPEEVFSGQCKIVNDEEAQNQGCP